MEPSGARARDTWSLVKAPIPGPSPAAGEGCMEPIRLIPFVSQLPLEAVKTAA